MRRKDMGRFWDARAREDPFFYIDDRLEYRKPDIERFWASGEQDLDTMLSALGAELRPDDDVVEIGCGIGRLTRVLAARARSVRALDVSPRMIELAREHNPDLAGVEWIVGGGSSLAGIEDDSADACISHVVLQHIPDPSVSLGYICEMGRVLRPGGWAAFQFSNAPRAPRRRLLSRAPRAQRDPRWLGSALALDAVRSAAGEAGMRVERVAGEGTQHCVALARRGAA